MNRLGLSNKKVLDLFCKADESGEQNVQSRVQWQVCLGSFDRREPVGASKAVSLFRHEAKEGYVTAQHNLARVYDRGRGIARVTSETIARHSEATSQGYTDSEARLTFLPEHHV